MALSFRGALGWLRTSWYGPAIPQLSPRCLTLLGRAQVANELAERALRPSDPLPFPGAEAVACELSREAIHWALSAHLELTAPGSQSATGANAGVPDSKPLETLWKATPPALIEEAAGGADPAQSLRADLFDQSFIGFAELAPDRQTATARRLHAFAGRLMAPLELPQRAWELTWVRRVKLVLVVLVLLSPLLLVAKSLLAKRELSLDMAPSASWEASSRYEPECSCQSPEQSCTACPNFFFCTAQENHPSVTFDLHGIRSLSAVVVDNRIDCCSERAVPLVVQVSSDHKHWKTVATRKTVFDTWRADFPTEQTRWVRLSVSRNDFLHLARVRLLP